MIRDRELLVAREAAGKAAAEVTKDIIKAATILLQMQVQAGTFDMKKGDIIAGFRNCADAILVTAEDVIVSLSETLANTMVDIKDGESWDSAPQPGRAPAPQAARKLSPKQVSALELRCSKIFQSKEAFLKWVKFHFAVDDPADIPYDQKGKQLMDDVFDRDDTGRLIREFPKPDPFEGE